MGLVWKSGQNLLNLNDQRIPQRLSGLTKLYQRLERYNELFENNLEGEIKFQSQVVPGMNIYNVSKLAICQSKF